MHDNIVSVFARGNQELFHSAFLAWLLSLDAPHGLGRCFLDGILKCLPAQFSTGLSGGYEVRTEFRERRTRFDILVRPAEPQAGTKGLVIENKIKSFGSGLQLDAYRNRGYNVAAFALLPETLDADAQANYPVVEYKVLRQVLAALPLSERNRHHFFIEQYVDFLDHTLTIFDLVRTFACGALKPQEFLKAIAAAVNGFEFSDNDVRTINYFYYYNLARYLQQQEPDLWFGELGYQDAEQQRKNTRWLYEKNMQGPPFMEAILHAPIAPNGWWSIDAPLATLYETIPFQVAPRLEVWLDLRRIAESQNAEYEIGRLMLGTWSDDLKRTLKDEPYRSRLKPCGERNFHRETISLSELPFAHLAERIRGMFRLLFDRRP